MRDARGGTLFVVATPLGNLEDASPRCRETLARAAVVYCEDTRRTGILLQHFGLSKPLLTCNEQDERRRVDEVVERLRAGEDVALVSDAGTPLVSDPGYRLVREALAAGIAVTSVPGPSAVTAALAASGLPPHPFRFLGFLPRTSGARRAALEAVRDDPATLAAFEAPHRLVATLRDAIAVLGDRPACLARNLTKPHERWQRGLLSGIVAELDTEREVRGEATLVLAGADSASVVTASAEEDAQALLTAGTPPRAVQDLLVRRHGLAKRDAYALVLRLRDGDR